MRYVKSCNRNCNVCGVDDDFNDYNDKKIFKNTILKSFFCSFVVKKIL